MNILKQIYTAEDSYRHCNGSKPAAITVNDQGLTLLKKALFPNLDLPKEVPLVRFDGMQVILNAAQQEPWMIR